MSLRNILATLSCARGATVSISAPAPTPTPTPTPGLIANPTLANTIDISPAAFTAMLQNDTATNDAVYRVDTSSGPVTITPGNKITTTKGFTFYASHRAAYDDNPFSEGIGTYYESLFTRLLKIQTLWEMQIPAGHKMRADFVQFERPPALWPDWVVLGQTWEDLSPSIMMANGRPWGLITPLGTGQCLELNYSRLRTSYGPLGLDLPAHDLITDLDAPSSGYYFDSRGRAQVSSDGTHTTPAEKVGLVAGALSNCRNYNSSRGEIYGTMQRGPRGIEVHPSTGYGVGIKGRFLHVSDIGSALGAALTCQGPNQIDMQGVVVDRDYCLMFQPSVEGMDPTNKIVMNNFLFRNFRNNSNDLYAAHGDLTNCIHSHASFMNWCEFRNWFVHWTGNESDPQIGLRFQPAQGGSTIPSYADSPIFTHMYLPGCNGGVMDDNLTLDPYLYDVVSLNPAYWQLAANQNSAETHAYRSKSGANVPDAPQTYGLMEKVTAEGIGTDCAVMKSVVTMTKADSTKQQAVFGSSILSKPANEAALFSLLTAGRGLPWSQLSDFLRAADWSHLPIHCQPAPVIGAATSTAVASRPTAIHGSNRDATFAGTVTNGTVEIRSRDARPAISPNYTAVAGTQLAAPSASPSLISGMKAVFATTTPSTKATVKDCVLTAGSRSFTFRTITASDNVFPVATLDGTFRLSRASGLGTTTSTTLSFAAIIKPSSFAGQQSLLCVSNGNAAVSIRLNSTTLTIQIINASSTVIAVAAFDNATQNLLSATADNQILVSIDRTQSDVMLGLRVFINGAQAAPQTGYVWSAGTMDLSGKVELFKDTFFGGGVAGFAGTVRHVWVSSENIVADIYAHWLQQPLIPEVGAGTTTAGTLAKPLSPTARQAEIQFVGKATRLNAGTNDGSLTTGWTVTGTATQTTDATWPL